MRVAFFVSEFPYLPAPYLAYQMSGLMKRGHEVEIFAARSDPTQILQPEIRAFDLVSKTRYFPQLRGNTFLRLGQACSLLARHFPKGPRSLMRSMNVYRYGKEARTLRLLACTTTCLQSSRQFDIIQCNFGPNGNLAALLRDVGAISGKLVTMFHRYDVALGFDKGPAVYAPLLKHGDCFLAISRENHKALEQLGFPVARIKDLRVGIPLDRFAYREPRVSADNENPIRILTIARLAPVKGLEYGLQSIKLLRKRIPDVKLQYTIVGYGELEAKLKELAGKLGLDDVVHFAGALDAATLIETMRRSDIFMLPSLAEGLPAVLMEAMAIGLPVVATNVSAVPELVLDGEIGFVVPPADCEALAAKLGVVIQSAELRAQFARRGRKRVEDRHDVEKLNDELVEIYRTLLA